MQLTTGQRAEVLIEALPYMQRFNDKTVVIKYGGNAMTDPALVNQLLQDIVLLRCVGVRPVVVHGGGPEINRLLTRLEIPSHFHNGLRVTDQQTMDVVQMVLTGKLNKDIVAQLCAMGASAIGLCGRDAGLLKCRKQMTDDGVDLGFVGEVVEVNDHLLRTLCQDGYIPVIAPVGVGEQGDGYNVNADTAASEIAAALQAEKLIFLTDIDGVRRQRDDPSSLIPELSCNQVRQLIEEGIIADGMIPKVMGCVNAVERGVGRVHIVSGTVPHAILLEMLTDSGVGTMVHAG